jgi:hypothetical protein
MVYSRIAVGVMAMAMLLGPSPAHARKPHGHHRVQAAKAPTHPIRFLGVHPVGPLARVVGGVVAEPEKGACRRWGPNGSRWHELDALGRIVGEVQIKGREYYDVSQCDELFVRQVSGHEGAGVYVDARVPYQAPEAKHWRPSRTAQAALERLVHHHQRGIENILPSLHVPFSKRSLFFERPSAHERYAMVGGRSLLLLLWRDDRWTIVYEEKPPKMRSQDRGYEPMAVVDMNGDGRPELVYQFREEGGEWYGDWTLSQRADGKWVRIRAGIFGSTA